MKVIQEHIKSNIIFWIFTFPACLLICALIPIYHVQYRYICNKNVKDLIWIAALFAFFISIHSLTNITFPKISLNNISKLKYLFTHGIYTKAKVVDIKISTDCITFYFQLIDPKYNNAIVIKTVSSLEYNKTFKIPKIPLKISITQNLVNQMNNDYIVKTSLITDNIVNLNEYYYLTLNSIVPILYDPHNKTMWMLCPFWNIWRRNHWLDDYPQDSIENKKIHRQREISESKLFKNVLKKYNIMRIVALLILAITTVYYNEFLIIVALIEFWLLLILHIWSHFYFKRHHDFYEYSIATMGTITSATEITERYGIKRQKFWIYKYTFTTKDGTPYQGTIIVSSKANMTPYKKNDPVTILYDPSCILQNCIAFYYPYSWIQPKETQKLYRIETIQPDIEESTSK